jgi:hypothetical protein
MATWTAVFNHSSTGFDITHLTGFDGLSTTIDNRRSWKAVYMPMN